MSFTQFDFHPDIQSGIRDAGYTSPSPIQQKAIPTILAGKDILGLAQTGTGKTVAFVLPILQHLLKTHRSASSAAPSALIMAPTRELAEQIHESITMMAIHTPVKSVAIYGGVGKPLQKKALKQGVDIVVACPGRLLDLMNEKALSLKGIDILVLDEADQMLDMGFLPDIKRIIRSLPQKRQGLVFSATMPKTINNLVQDILNHPIKVQVNQTGPAPRIAHGRFNVQREKRTALLKTLFSKTGMASTIVFTRTKHKAKSLAVQLKKSGFNAVSLQGNLSQNQRRRAMDGFRSGSFKILVATDIAARGIDVSGVSHVINYDLPDTVETYIHRTGRTGRVNQPGQAYTFTTREDNKTIGLIEKALGRKMTEESLIPV